MHFLRDRLSRHPKLPFLGFDHSVSGDCQPRSPIQLAYSPLAVILVDGDLKRFNPYPQPRLQLLPQLLGYPPRQLLGGRVADGQQHAVLAGENPTLFMESHGDLAIGHVDLDERMFGRQQHVMIQATHNVRQRIAEGDEVDDVLILVQRTADLGFDPIIVPVQTFADVTGKGNEVG